MLYTSILYLNQFLIFQKVSIQHSNQNSQLIVCKLYKLLLSFIKMSIRHTKAPWPVNKVYTDPETVRDFKSPQYVEQSLFQAEAYSLPEWVPQDYLIDFELFLQEINQHFGIKYIDSASTRSFEHWFKFQYKDLFASSDVFPFKEFYFESSVMIAHIAYSPKHGKELVLRYVITRPCAEGLGLYKILLYQLCLIVKRERWSKLLIHHCLKENAEILRSKFRFTETVAYENSSFVNFFVELPTIESEICIGMSPNSSSMDMKRLPWRLDQLIEEADTVRGIKLKLSPMFPYANQLNNPAYVNAKHDNKAGAGIDYNTPAMGYPDPRKRQILDQLFLERDDSYTVISERNQNDAIQGVSRYTDEIMQRGRTRRQTNAIHRPIIPRIKDSKFIMKYIESGIADRRDFPAPTSTRPQDIPQTFYIEQMQKHMSKDEDAERESRPMLDSDLEPASQATKSSIFRDIAHRLTGLFRRNTTPKRSYKSKREYTDRVSREGDDEAVDNYAILHDADIAFKTPDALERFKEHLRTTFSYGPKRYLEDNLLRMQRHKPKSILGFKSMNDTGEYKFRFEWNDDYKEKQPYMTQDMFFTFYSDQFIKRLIVPFFKQNPTLLAYVLPEHKARVSDMLDGHIRKDLLEYDLLGSDKPSVLSNTKKSTVALEPVDDEEDHSEDEDVHKDYIRLPDTDIALKTENEMQHFEDYLMRTFPKDPKRALPDFLVKMRTFKPIRILDFKNSAARIEYRFRFLWNDRHIEHYPYMTQYMFFTFYSRPFIRKLIVPFFIQYPKKKQFLLDEYKSIVDEILMDSVHEGSGETDLPEPSESFAASDAAHKELDMDSIEHDTSDQIVDDYIRLPDKDIALKTTDQLETFQQNLMMHTSEASLRYLPLYLEKMRRLKPIQILDFKPFGSSAEYKFRFQWNDGSREPNAFMTQYMFFTYYSESFIRSLIVPFFSEHPEKVAHILSSYSHFLHEDIKDVDASSPLFNTRFHNIQELNEFETKDISKMRTPYQSNRTKLFQKMRTHVPIQILFLNPHSAKMDGPYRFAFEWSDKTRDGATTMTQDLFFQYYNDDFARSLLLPYLKLNPSKRKHILPEYAHILEDPKHRSSSNDQVIDLRSKDNPRKRKQNPDHQTVEKIVNMAILNGETGYIVKWIGLDNTHNSFVSQNEIDPNILQAYHSSIKTPRPRPYMSIPVITGKKLNGGNTSHDEHGNLRTIQELLAYKTAARTGARRWSIQYAGVDLNIDDSAKESELREVFGSNTINNLIKQYERKHGVHILDDIATHDDTEEIMEEDEESFTVERIVRKATQRGQQGYIVKWLGYKDEDNSFVSTEELEENCSDMIHDFEEQLKQKKMGYTIPKRLRVEVVEKIDGPRITRGTGSHNRDGTLRPIESFIKCTIPNNPNLRKWLIKYKNHDLNLEDDISERQLIKVYGKDTINSLIRNFETMHETSILHDEESLDAGSIDLRPSPQISAKSSPYASAKSSPVLSKSPSPILATLPEHPASALVTPEGIPRFTPSISLTPPPRRRRPSM